MTGGADATDKTQEPALLSIFLIFFKALSCCYHNHFANKIEKRMYICNSENKALILQPIQK